MRMHSPRAAGVLLVALGSAFCVLLAGTSATAAAPTTTSVAATPVVPSSLLQQKLAWFPCYPDGSFPELQCAYVDVPRDWAHPSGPTIYLEISRIKASDPHKRRGVLFSNPGGPGVPGLTMPLFFEQAEPDLAAAYDLIGVDVRGVGNSQPLNCAPPSIANALYSLDGRDTSAANQRRFQQLSAQYGQTCSRSPLTPYITDQQTVRDLDLVRALLCEQKISYIGYSAGTLLGAEYASTFPDRVDRFVFDGNLDFTSPLYDSFARQPHGFQISFERAFLPYVAKYQDVYGLGATAAAVNQTYEKRRAALAAKPLRLVDGSLLTASQYDFGVSNVGYWIGYYDPVATAMQVIEHYSAATADQKQFVADYFGGEPADGADPFWAVVCQNDPSPSYAKIVADTNRFRIHDPLLGANWNAEPCPFFTTGVAGRPVDGRKLPPVLMINNDYDPATPLANALSAHAKTPNSVLITVRNEPDHTIYGSGDTCVESYANRYLLRGILPAKDVSCQGLPIPAPAALSAADTLRAAAVGPGTGVPVRDWLEQLTADHGRPVATR